MEKQKTNFKKPSKRSGRRVQCQTRTVNVPKITECTKVEAEKRSVCVCVCAPSATARSRLSRSLSPNYKLQRMYSTTTHNPPATSHHPLPLSPHSPTLTWCTDICLIYTLIFLGSLGPPQHKQYETAYKTLYAHSAGQLPRNRLKPDCIHTMYLPYMIYSRVYRWNLAVNTNYDSSWQLGLLEAAMGNKHTPTHPHTHTHTQSIVFSFQELIQAAVARFAIDRDRNRVNCKQTFRILCATVTNSSKQSTIAKRCVISTINSPPIPISVVIGIGIGIGNGICICKSPEALSQFRAAKQVTSRCRQCRIISSLY